MKFFRNFFKKDTDDDELDEQQPASEAKVDEEAFEPLVSEDDAGLTLESEEEAVAEGSTYDELASYLDSQEVASEEADFLAMSDVEEEEEPSQFLPHPPADTIYVPAGRILPDLPNEYLCAPTSQLVELYQNKPDFVFSFNRSDLMYSLSRGKLEMPVGDLVTKIAINVFSDDIADKADQVVSLPLHQVVPLIPVEWMKREDQDDSKERIIEDLDDYFRDLGTPAPEAPAAAGEEEVPVDEEQYAAADAQQAIPTEQHVQPALEEPEYEEADEELTYRQEPQYEAEEEEEEAYEPEIELSVEDDYAAQPVVGEPEADDEEVPATPEGFVSPWRDQDVATGGRELPSQPPAPEEIINEFPELDEEEFDLDESLAANEQPLPPAVTDEELELDIEDEELELDIEDEELELDIELEEELAEELEAEEAAAAAPVQEEPSAPVLPPVPKAPEPEEILPELEEKPAARQPAVEEPEEPVLQDSMAELEYQDPADVARDYFGQKQKRLEMHEKANVATGEPRRQWTSHAPNGIDLNRSGISSLTVLPGIGTHMAKLIVDYRNQHGPFTDVRQLMDIVGLGRHTYRGMAGLSPSGDLAEAELELNRVLGIESESISISEVTKAALKKLHLQAMFVTGPDGLLLAKATVDKTVDQLGDSMAGIAPRLWARARRNLQQGKLPEADMITFYIGRYAVTFGGSEDVLCACVHNSAYPSRRDLKAMRKVMRELVWYCSYRAVI